jgi:nucleotide-binding universal stress UspA family protein
MNKILAIIDKPENQVDFIRNAAKLSIDLQTDLLLLYIQNPGSFAITDPKNAGMTSIEIQKNLELLAESIGKTLEEKAAGIQKEFGDKIKIETSVEIGITSLTVENYINDSRAQMVVMEGQENKKIWGQITTIMDVIRHVDCPVWIFPHPYSYKPVKEVVYATDYHKGDLETLQKLVEMLDQMTPSITALHVSKNVDFEEKVKNKGLEESLQQETGYDQIKVEALSREIDENTAGLINEYALSSKADLLVVLKENRHFLDRIFAGSSTKKIINEAHIPVLVYHEK